MRHYTSSVTFTGTRLDGGTVQQTYTTDSKFEAETVVLSGFSGLTSFRFTFNETTWDDLQWSYSAPLDVSFGLAEVRAASGNVSIAASRLELTNVLTLSVPNTVELWQSITGSGGLVKAGSGTVRVSSQAKYTGLTKVVSGLLKVDGSLAGSVTADGPGKVSGVGLVSGVLETSGTGSLLPGGIPGVLAAGGLQLGASGTAGGYRRHDCWQSA
jgi:autotransporter-associated beta strand protein